MIWASRIATSARSWPSPTAADVPNFERVVRLPEASHWVQPEEPERVGRLLIEFFSGRAEREPAA